VQAGLLHLPALAVRWSRSQREGREQCASEKRAAANQPRANRPNSIPRTLPTTPASCMRLTLR